MSLAVLNYGVIGLLCVSEVLCAVFNREADTLTTGDNYVVTELKQCLCLSG